MFDNIIQKLPKWYPFDRGTVSSSMATHTWWRHQMETFSALLAICVGNSPVPGEFPTQRQVTRSFDVFFDLRLNKRLSKQSWGWWLETLSRPLCRPCNEFKDQWHLDLLIFICNSIKFHRSITCFKRNLKSFILRHQRAHYGVIVMNPSI